MKLYQDKEWLCEKYLKEKLSTTQIGKLCKRTKVTIGRWLMIFNIPRRSQSEYHHLATKNNCRLSEEALQWINGELLGDAHLELKSCYSARFHYGSKYLEYIEYVRDTLKSFGIEQAGNIQRRHITHRNMDTYAYDYCSKAYPELLPIRKQWYPEGKKIIPKDIKLTPLTLRQHYIGDGYLSHREKRNPHIILCSDAFPISCVNWFICQLKYLGFKTTRQPSHNRIHISSYSAKDFLSYIGICPVQCYQYKFNY